MTFQTTFDEKVKFLNKELIHKYESALAERKKMSERWNRPGSKKQQQMREIFQKSNVDLKALDEIEKQSFTEQQEFLNEIRPELISRAPKSLEGRSRLAMKCAVQSGSRVIPLLGTTLLAGDHASIEGNPGEKGNPWILPWNPGQVKIKVAYTPFDQDWGCEGDFGGVTYRGYPASSVFFFAFMPPTEGTWNLTALVNMFGFYMVQADDKVYNCKSCKATISVTVDVFQYFWTAANPVSLLDIDTGNINTAQLITQFGEFDCQVYLRTTDWAIVQVSVNLFAYANGAGSYSEINFSDGAGNFIEPLVMFANLL